MSASRSTRRNTESEPRAANRRAAVLVIAIAVLAVLGIFASALPASFILHFMPPNAHADDLSGSLWHGAAGRFTIAGRDVGAVEWRIHPAALLHFALEADLHWVHRGFGAEANAVIARSSAALSAIHGGGPIEDLQEFGVARGWRGTVEIALDKLGTDYARISSARGDIKVAGLSAAKIAEGADLGSYVLHLGDDAVDANGVITGQISDAGGPLSVQGTITASPPQHTGSLSATIQERADLAAELRTEIANLAQLRGRDRSGRIPIELEFSF
jgi:Type II secretion system (T2SS), protein N